MKRHLFRLLAVWMACCIALTGCSGFAKKDAGNKTGEEAPGVSSPTSTGGSSQAWSPGAVTAASPRNLLSVGEGFKFPAQPRIPEGFRSRYPVAVNGAWESGVKPIFDPLGGQTAYKNYRYRYETGKLTYMNVDYRQETRHIAGEHWHYEFPVPNLDDMLHLEQYLLDLGGEILSVSGDDIAFVIRDEGYQWWGRVRTGSASDKEIQLLADLWREMYREAGEPLTVTAGMGEGGLLYFTTAHRDGWLQSMKAELPERQAKITAYGYYHLGDYRKETKIDFTLTTANVPNGVALLDHIPQEPGDLHWTVDTSASSIPDGQSLTLTIDEVLEIAPVTMGESLGALLVKGAPWGSVDVQINRYGLTTRHTALPNNRVIASQTGEGDTLIWLPAGYWTVTIAGHGNRLIPVSAGELTVMTAPTNLRRDDLEDATSSGAAEKPIIERGLRFLAEPRESGETVELDFLIYDSEYPDLQPAKEDLLITENNLPAEALTIKPLDLPPNIVLLLDSSGSMEGQLEATLEAAKAFVAKMPEDATIQIVEFSSTVKTYEGYTKEQAVQNIDKITLGGSTALYGAVVAGLGLLQGMDRASLIAFTDGVNEPSRGGLTDKGAVLDAIAKAGIPVYCIGFGPEHAPPPQPAPDPSADPDEPPPEPEVKPSDLRDFASLSGGRYYSAADQDALTKVFDAIAARIGNAFTAVYQRPKAASLPDVPVVMLVVDSSGSMGARIAGGSKIEHLKTMYRQFILDAPDGVIMQAMDFNFVNFQMLTTEKSSMLSALYGMQSEGGTNVKGAAQHGYSYLMDVATSKRILIFVTDDAMLDPAADKTGFDSLLEDIKEAGIYSLWVGMTNNDARFEAIYRRVAEYAGGSYAVSADASTLNDSLKQMLDAIAAPPGAGVNSKIELQVLLGESGFRRSYQGTTGASLAPLPPAQAAIAPPEALSVVSGLPLDDLFLHGADSVRTLSGSSPSGDTRILAHVSLNADKRNAGLEVRATDLYRLSRLRGVDAPEGMVYIALWLEMKNLLGDRPAAVPNITSHFYLTLDDSEACPASRCTWLAEAPLPIPGDLSLSIPPEESRSGMLIFLTGDRAATALQLSLYDAVNGDIHLTLMGEPRGAVLQTQPLPKAAFAALSGGVTFTLTGYSDVLRVGSHAAASGMVYRVVEGNITSADGGRFPFDPKAEVYLDIATANGSFFLPLSPLTEAVPLGYMSPRTLSAGVAHPFRWVFEVPDPLTDAKAGIYGNAPKDAFQIPLRDGLIYPAQPAPGVYAGDLIDLTINELGLLSRDEYRELTRSFDITQEKAAADHEAAENKRRQEAERKGQPYVPQPMPSVPAAAAQDYSGACYLVADVTIHDKVDGYSTSYGKIFELLSERITWGDKPGEVMLDGTAPTERQVRDLIVSPDGITSRLALGIDSSFITPDGQSRRGLLVFRLENRDFYLGSAVFPDLRAPVPDAAYGGAALLRPKVQPQKTNLAFAAAIEKQIRLIREQYRAAQPEAAAATINKPPEGFSLARDPESQEFAVPVASAYGALRLAGARSGTVEQALDLLRSMAWRPSVITGDSRSRRDWASQYAPEAALTQEWGTEYDLALLAEKLLAGVGLTTARREVVLTELGRQSLRAYLGIGPPSQTDGSATGKQAPPPFSTLETLPALSYVDSAGEGHLLVFPFVREIRDLQGYASPKGDSSSIPETGTESAYATLTVSLEAIPLSPAAKNGEAGLFNIGGVLDGLNRFLTATDESPDEPRTQTVLEQKFALTDLSMDAVDVSFAVNAEGDWLAYSDSALGQLPGSRTVSAADYRPLKAVVSVVVGALNYSHETVITEDLPLERLFYTIGLNLPDLPGSAVSALDSAMGPAAAHTGAGNPDPHSYLRLYHRASLYSFIAAQTSAEDIMAESMGLTLGRTAAPRLVILTSRQGADGRILTGVDLAQAFNDIHNAQSVAEEAVHGFNIGSGLTMCELERDCLPGNQSAGYLELWERLPQDGEGFRPMLLIPNDRQPRRAVLAEMEARGGYPARLLDAVRNSDKVILTPQQAAPYDGTGRWAWLEIDPKTYQTISVFDDGRHGAMLEYMILLNSNDFALGAVGGFYSGFVVTGASFASVVLRNFDALEAIAAANRNAAMISTGMNLATGALNNSMEDVMSTLPGLFGDEALALAASIAGGIISSGDHPLQAGFKMGFDLGSAAYIKMLESASPQ